MIKKLNIALAVLFAAMFAVKGLKSVRRANADDAAAAPAAGGGAGEMSTLSPRVFYEYWSGYTLQNPISNRNGVLLDIIRAIFPNATFSRINGGIEDFANKLRSDGHAVLVGFGAHSALAEFRVAPTPLMNCPLALMTLRSNPWHYVDYSSLTNIRIVASEGFLDYSVLKRLREDTENGAAKLRTLPSHVTKVEMGEMVLRGEADAFVLSDLQNSDVATRDGLMSARFVHSFRKSSAITSEGTVLYVSGLDPDFASRVIDEYEAGLRRIDASGELRRIMEYYEIPYAPLQPKGN